MPVARAAYSAPRDNQSMRALLDLSGRFAPSEESVRSVILGARAIVTRGPYHRGLLLSALADSDTTRGLAAWHARRMLCRLLAEPSLPVWLDAPFTSRGEVLRLLSRAARCFAPAHRGGWHISSRPFARVA